MRDNTKRNRNIGTVKQGYGQNNKMKVSSPYYKNDMRIYLERLTNYKREIRKINEHEFVFIVEETLQDYAHACSIEDVVHLLHHIPREDYGDIRYIVFRQPKRKEEKLEPVWGRLRYSFEFEKEDYPAIILEAFPIAGKLTWSKKLQIDDRLEFLQLGNDGFVFEDKKKFYQAEKTKENVRNVQLYRTLFHEFGHYVQYLNMVDRPEKKEEDYEEWEKRWNFYNDSIPGSEKEAFAHNYADRLKERLIEENIIPFERKEDKL